MIKNMSMHVRALVNWTSGDIPGALLAPHFNNSFGDAMDKSTITDRGEHMRLGWKTTLNPRQQDPLAALTHVWTINIIFRKHVYQALSSRMIFSQFGLN